MSLNKIKSYLSLNLDGHTKEILHGSSVALILKAFGVGFQFGFSIILARKFGAEGTGAFFLTMTVMMIVATIGRFGLDNTVLRFIASNASTKNWIAVKGVYKQSVKITLIASTFLSILLFASAPWMAESIFHKNDLSIPLRQISFAVPFVAITYIFGELLKGLKNIRDSQIVQGVAVPGFFLIGLLTFGNRFGLNGVIWIYVISTIISALLGFFLWTHSTLHLKSIKGQFDRKDIYDSSVPLFWMSIMQIIIFWAPSLALGVWGSKADVGIFNIAFRTAMLTSFILIAVNSISAPKFAALFKQNNLIDLSRTSQNSCRIMTVVATPVLLIFILAPSKVLSLFGPDFINGSKILIILALGQFINVATGSVGYILTMTGNERLMSANIIVVGFFTIILYLILIPTLGILGAAIACSISMILRNIIACIIVWRKLNILTFTFGNNAIYK